jgi:hypothetical protein
MPVYHGNVFDFCHCVPCSSSQSPPPPPRYKRVLNELFGFISLESASLTLAVTHFLYSWGTGMRLAVLSLLVPVGHNGPYNGLSASRSPL